MTVMFCDLVGSTPLAERLDPEDFHELLLGYQALCATSIARFNGYTALYVGDGVVAYFGYPRAHEDDAQRAVHASLGILDGLDELNDRLQASFGETINVRIGLHSGIVVVAENFGEQREQHEIIGETPAHRTATGVDCRPWLGGDERHDAGPGGGLLRDRAAG